MVAIETARTLAREQRPATEQEQRDLARWSSWGAIPQVFDATKQDWAAERKRLREILSDEEWDAARRTTVNAHYTDAGIVEAMWQALRDLGFDGGTVLEPGCGSGTFVGFAPSNASMTGVELDPMTASIASALYPHAAIRHESFADTRFPDGYFDAAIGNVPFADVCLRDLAYNQGQHSMHNHFIIKSLRLTRPGGLVAVLTSSFTMDAANPMARDEMHDLADLVGAVRLPNGTHRRAAGTEALTDLLIFRRRPLSDTAEESRDAVWTHVGPHQLDADTKITLNTYFAEHPERVLGTLAVGQGEGGQELTVVRSDDLSAVPEQLREALGGIVEEARQEGLLAVAPSPQERQRAADVEMLRTSLRDGTVVAVDGEQYPAIEDEDFQVAINGLSEPFPVFSTQVEETRALLDMRDAARELLVMERSTPGSEETPELEAARAGLRGLYTAYVETYGPINRYTVSLTGRQVEVIDPLSGLPLLDKDGEVVTEPGTRRLGAPAVSRLVKSDADMALVTALENFDDATQEAAPALLLTQRQITERRFAEQAENPAEALAMSLDRVGRVDLDIIAELLDVDPGQVRDLLGELVYHDPALERLVPAAEYLSGNVVVKLEQAQQAAEQNPAFEPNVRALAKVIPEPVGLEDIRAQMGAVWIDAATHEAFLRETLNDPHLTVENPMPGVWNVKGNRRSVEATNTWGTERRPAPVLAQALMEQTTIKVMDSVKEDGKTKQIANPVETQAALDKAEELQNRFAEWVWEEPERANRLQAAYNRQFNNLVLRDYTEAGEHLTLPGLAGTLSLLPHQRTAVARMINEPAVGLFHEVGAGKTLEMVCGSMELKRMGLVNKPAVVVPNHMLGQFTREWLQAYPSAQLLAASSASLSGQPARRRFVAKVAANEWDAVIMTQDAFKLLGVAPSTEAEYIREQIDQTRVYLDAARESGLESRSVKQVEKALMRQEEDLKTALGTHRDAGLTFEATGIDYLVVDEAHMYKNLGTASSKPEAAIQGTQRAADMHMKFEYLRQRNGQRVGTMATATPIANSITEAHVMQRYLRPDLFHAAGLHTFDTWLSTFTVDEPSMEVTATGQFKMKSRLKFTNVADMMKMWHVFADVKTAEDLNLPTPLLAPRASDGAREIENVVVAPTPELRALQHELGQRAERLSYGSREDNMLKISHEGRSAALDMRLLTPYEPVRPSGEVKLDKVAQTVLAEWERTRDAVYTDLVTGEESPIRGGLQLVFSDLGVPKPDRWNVYQELRTLLVQGGMPAQQVRFIHEAKNDAEKARMFEAARTGHIAVLIGSTEKMGVGTNVQNRVTALHHVDCPWRPADIQQREGRAIRRGNQNEEVRIFRYLTEASFDGFTWGKIQQKASFIGQVVRSTTSVREMEDIGDLQASAGVATAIGSGNPLMLEKAEADQELSRLQRRYTAYTRAQTALRTTRDNARADISHAEENLALLRAAAERTVDVRGEAFRMTVEGVTFSKRTDAAESIAAWADRENLAMWMPGREPVVMGSIGGHDVLASRMNLSDGYEFKRYAVFELAGVPGSRSEHKLADVLKTNLGLVRTLENKPSAIDHRITTTERTLATARSALASAEANIGKPFTDREALDQARERVRHLAEEIAQLQKEEESPTQEKEQEQAAQSEGPSQSAPPVTHASPDSASQPGPEAPQTPPEKPEADHTRFDDALKKLREQRTPPPHDERSSRPRLQNRQEEQRREGPSTGPNTGPVME